MDLWEEGEVAGLDRFELEDLIESDADDAVVRNEIDNSRRAKIISPGEADNLELALKDRKPASGELFETETAYQ